MTAIVLPDIDRATLEDLKKRMPDLKEIELPNLPSMKQVSKTADETIDRLLGRSRAPVWPWIAAAIGLAAVVGIVAAWFAWFRKPAWQAEPEPEPWSEEQPEATSVATQMPAESMAGVAADDVALKPVMDDERSPVMDDELSPVGSRSRSSKSGGGLSAVESSLGSTPYPIEET
jgi:hypothetical protein